MLADRERRSLRARLRRLRLPVGRARIEEAEEAASDPGGAIVGSHNESPEPEPSGPQPGTAGDGGPPEGVPA